MASDKRSTTTTSKLRAQSRLFAANLLALASFLLTAYTVSCWLVKCMKHGMLARLASPFAFPLIVMIAVSSALGSWINWKEKISAECPIALFLWPHVIGLGWTFSFFVLHSVYMSLMLAILGVAATLLTTYKNGGLRTVAGALHVPLALWAVLMLAMNIAFAAVKMGLISFTGLQWWGIKHVGLGIFHTAQHLLLG